MKLIIDNLLVFVVYITLKNLIHLSINIINLINL